jgi:hypothetical protein
MTVKKMSELNCFEILLIDLDLIIRPVIGDTSLPCPHLASFSLSLSRTSKSNIG